MSKTKARSKAPIPENINNQEKSNSSAGSQIINKLRKDFSAEVSKFKLNFTANPHILSLGQYHVANLVLIEIKKVVNEELLKKPDKELQEAWRFMISNNGFLFDNLIDIIKKRNLQGDYPNIVKIYTVDTSATSAWAGLLYDQFWNSSTIEASPSVSPATRDRYKIAFENGGPLLKDKRIGEKSACFNSTNALARKYIKVQKLPPISKDIKIDSILIPLTQSVPKPTNKEIQNLSYDLTALPKIIERIKKVLKASYPVLCGVLSGINHDKSKFPNPEHYILVFAYTDDNSFLFWDSNINASNIQGLDWGPGFGVLFATDSSFSTSFNRSDLSSIVIGEAFSGDHINPPNRRHRYQVYNVRSLSL
jgi:hypothetical protein